MDGKPPKNKLTDFILSSRWGTVLLNGVVVSMCSAAALITFADEKVVLFGINVFMVGFSLRGMLVDILIPGLMKQFGEIERAVVSAQIEKQIRETIAEIKRQHPEIRDLEIGRIQ
jgi:hypothetical protein